MGRLIHRSEAAWLAAIVALSGVGIVLGVHTSAFYADDVVNLALSHNKGLTVDVLTTDYFGHLSPVHRVFDWLIFVTGSHWPVAVALMLACWLVAVLAFYAVVRQLVDRGFLALASTAMFASTPAWVRSIEWPASGELLGPATAFTLIGLAAALHWHRTRVRWALVTALVASLAGVLTYEKPVLLVLYVAGIVLFVRATSLRPRDLWAVARRDAPLLGGLLAIAVVYVIVLKAFDYAPAPGSVSLTEWTQYLRATWTRGTTLLLVGQTVGAPNPLPYGPFLETMVWVAEALFVVLVAWSIARRLSAWRAWAFYGVAWVVNVSMVGYGRIAPFGVLIGLDARYSAEIAYLLPITLVLAFAPDEPGEGRVRGLAVVRRAEDAVRAAFARHRGLAYAALAPLVVLWILSCANAYTRLADTWPGGAAGTITDRWVQALDRVSAAGPATVVDSYLPFAVSAGLPLRTSDWLHVDRPDFRFNAPSGPVYVLQDDGQVRRARHLHTAYSAPLRMPNGCLQPGQGIDVRPPRPVEGKQLVVQLGLSRASASRVSVFLDNRNEGYPGRPNATQTIEPGDPRVRLDAGGGPVYQIRVVGSDAVLCADRLSVLAFE